MADSNKIHSNSNKKERSLHVVNEGPDQTAHLHSGQGLQSRTTESTGTV